MRRPKEPGWYWLIRPGFETIPVYADENQAWIGGNGQTIDECLAKDWSFVGPLIPLIPTDYI